MSDPQEIEHAVRNHRGFWLVVMGSAEAIDWTYATGRLAFRATVKENPNPGDRFALYATTAVTRSAQRGSPQLLAMGKIESEEIEEGVLIAGELFPRQHEASFEMQFDVSHGVPFRPIVPEMEFIRSKRGWAAYVHRTLVALSEADFGRLQVHMEQHSPGRGA